MTKYRKLPVTIDAVQYLNTKEGIAAVLRFVDVPIIGVFPDHLTVKTREGTMRIDPFDWIVRSIHGGYSVCHPSIFDATYELVAESQPR